jgi:predicted peroxiredoxin
MTQGTNEVVFVMTRGTDHELSSVGFTLANGALTSGMTAYAFLTSSAVDLVRKGALETTQVKPLEPLRALVEDFIRRGGTVWACPPCVAARGYTADSFIEGVKIQGASAVFERLKAGAATMSF